MKTKEIFGLIIRVIGLCVFGYVLRHLINDVTHTFRTLTVVYFVLKLAYLGIGLYLVGGAPQLVEFAYPEKSESPAGK